MDRRQFILTASQAALAAWLLPACTRSTPEQWLISTCNDTKGQTLAAAINQQGQVVNTVKLPARGHDSLALPHKPGHALVFARRPDRFAIEIDFASGQIVRHIQSQADTHFYGHGVLSRDNQYLYTTENFYAKKRGLVVVRDAVTYQVLDRFDSGGIGPHELGLMPDGQTLVIANGGIETHPEQRRKKLNIHNMQPNLAYLDIASGKVLGSYQPPDHQLSLRHLDVAPNGTVYVGAQYQGHPSTIHPLLFSHQGETTLRAFHADDSQWHNMHQYTASLLVKEDWLCVSCPRGAHLSFWDTQTHHFVSQQKLRDVSGLAKAAKTVYASTGKGILQELSADTSPLNPRENHQLQLKFDNHMTMINAPANWRPFG